MASPKTHLFSTTALIVLWWLFTPLVWSKNWVVLALVIFFGFLIDIDHVPFRIRNLKAYLEGKLKHSEALGGQKRFFHLWLGLVLALLTSFLAASAFPFLSYGIHIWIDSGAGWYKKPYLPYYAGFLYPKWLMYGMDSATVVAETIPRLYQKFMCLMKKI